MKPNRRRSGLMLLNALLVFAIFGCGNNPGKWTESQIISELKSGIPATEVVLKKESDGVYSGTAKSADNKEFQLTVKQDTASGTLEWNAESADGDVLSGNFKKVNAY